jgi:hypothetical protein
MSDTRRTHDTHTGRRLSARRVRAARGQVASYIHEMSDRHRNPTHERPPRRLHTRRVWAPAE